MLRTLAPEYKGVVEVHLLGTVLYGWSDLLRLSSPSNSQTTHRTVAAPDLQQENHIDTKPRFVMSGTLIIGYKTNKNSSTHSKFGTC